MHTAAALTLVHAESGAHSLRRPTCLTKVVVSGQLPASQQLFQDLIIESSQTSLAHHVFRRRIFSKPQVNFTAASLASERSQREQANESPETAEAQCLNIPRKLLAFGVADSEGILLFSVRRSGL